MLIQKQNNDVGNLQNCFAFLFKEVKMVINDVTDKDIEELNDADLRDLIGKLCEVTLNKYGIDPICVTYGGNQDEPDGGVDVRVKSTEKFNDDWAIPRNNTIIQVKKPSMPDSAIQKEMMNKDGSIKECIKELVELNGAYIIVSSGDSLADKRKSQRISCMKNVLSSIDNTQKIKVDFYDGKRIATWVKQFPALVMWVNEKVHKRTSGWNTYYNWSNPNEVEKDFIIDKETFLHRDNFEEKNLLSIEDGINEIRNLLLQERKIVRLAGLSGVGKTRFAQALFDEKIGQNVLNKEKVIYCDIGNNPTPVPITFIQDIIALEENIVVIVDNCEKELHDKLANFVCADNSKISLLTIEYDVKEDTDTESYNYYLDTSSDDTIRKLLKRDFNYIEDNNIETIVSCSDGNFRIARYLAKTIDKNESIGTLKSEELFKRLFIQNNIENSDLLDIGRICSAFISFNIEYDDKNYNNELNIIGRIINKNSIDLIRNIKELNNRQIIQSRGNMRAVLPHAIANRLADEFLSAIPIDFFINEIKNSKRLELSFFRRLKFLHDKEYSIKIAELHLEQIDFLNIDKHEMAILDCIKVISPEKILYKLEQIDIREFFTRNNNFYYEWSRILLYIAYDSKLFFRATMLIVEFAKSEKVGENYNSIRDILYKLFHIMLSGTHAPIEERLKIIDLLIYDSCEISNELALKLIDELLEIGGFIGQIVGENTSRKRDYGYLPKTNQEFRNWYITILEDCNRLIKNNIFKDRIKEILANNFRNLSSIGLYYDLEKIVEDVLKGESWPQIWISIGVIKHFDIEKVPDEMLEKMNNLQEKCFPKTIDDKIIVFLSKGRHVYWELDDITENDKKSYEMVKQLGIEIRNNPKEFKKNLLKINNFCNLYRIDAFTEGLFEEKNNHFEIIYFLLDNINEENKEVFLRMISTYIALLNEKAEANQILDEILNDKNYKLYYPRIQFGYQLKDIDVIRVKKALSMEFAPIQDYCRIEFALDNVCISNIIGIFDLFPKNSESDNLIISILHNLYWNNKKNEELDEYARKFIANLDFSNRNHLNDHLNYEIGQIVEKCFLGINDKKQVIQVFDNFIKIMDVKGGSYYEYKYILEPLIKLYPTEFLDKLLSNNEIEHYKIRYFVKGYGHHENAINLIDDDVLINWVKENDKAYELSNVINPIKNKDGVYIWTGVSKYLIENYIDNKKIIENIINGIYPNSWTDKYSSVLKRRLGLAKELQENNNLYVKKLGILLEQKLNSDIYRIEKQEEKEQDRYNTFEYD